MDDTIKVTILRALELYRGDDLERAQRAFTGLTPKQMSRPYGQSGKTCQQILDSYLNHVDRVRAAQDFVKTQ